LAFVLPAAAGAPVRLIDLGAAAEIDSLVDKVREKWELSANDLTDPGEKRLEETYRAEAKKLYDAAFAPLSEALGKAPLVYLAPDGALDRVPFEALPDGPRSYLIESRRFVYLSCGRDLLRPKDPPGRGALIIAGPDYDMKAADRLAKVKELLGKPPEPPGSLPAYGPARQSGEVAWKALPKAADEAEAVRAAVDQGAYGPAKVYRGAEALEEVFKAKTRPAPRLLHVVTHGFFFPEPEPDPPDEAGAPVPWAGVEKPAGRGRIKTMKYPLLRSGLVLAGANAVGEGAPEAALLDDGYLTAA
jgi:CHAT domain-containing protein